MPSSQDGFSPESPQDHMARGKTVAEIAARMDEEREHALNEAIEDLKCALIDCDDPKEAQIMERLLLQHKAELFDLRQQQADAAHDARRFVDPKLSAADRNSGRF